LGLKQEYEEMMQKEENLKNQCESY